MDTILKTVCRTCLRIPKQSESIKLFDDDGRLLHKIKLILSIKIENIEELSTFICRQCLTFINCFYNFLKLVKNTHHDLKTRLKTLKATNGLTKRNEKYKMNQSSDYLDSNGGEIEFVDIEQCNSPVKKTNQIKESKRIRKIKCGHCNRIFDTRRKLASHKVTHRPNVACNICGTIVRDVNLKKHQILHFGKPCQCNDCGKICKNSDALNRHMKYNHGERAFTCEVCGNTYTRMSNLRAHKKNHQELEMRRKLCPTCGVKVVSVTEHMITHTKEKLSTCQYCNKTLSCPYALKVHMRIHTNEKPYLCKFCDSSFPQRVSLRTHLTKEHGMSLIGNKYTKVPIKSVQSNNSSLRQAGSLRVHLKSKKKAS